MLHRFGKSKAMQLITLIKVNYKDVSFFTFIPYSVELVCLCLYLGGGLCVKEIISPTIAYLEGTFSELEQSADIRFGARMQGDTADTTTSSIRVPSCSLLVVDEIFK